MPAAARYPAVTVAAVRLEIEAFVAVSVAVGAVAAPAAEAAIYWGKLDAKSILLQLVVPHSRLHYLPTISHFLPVVEAPFGSPVLPPCLHIPSKCPQSFASALQFSVLSASILYLHLFP